MRRASTLGCEKRVPFGPRARRGVRDFSRAIFSAAATRGGGSRLSGAAEAQGSAMMAPGGRASRTSVVVAPLEPKRMKGDAVRLR